MLRLCISTVHDQSDEKQVGCCMRNASTATFTHMRLFLCGIYMANNMRWMKRLTANWWKDKDSDREKEQVQPKQCIALVEK